MRKTVFVFESRGIAPSRSLVVMFSVIKLIINVLSLNHSYFKVSELDLDHRPYSWFRQWHLCHFSVQFSRSVVSDCLQPHESQQARPPYPSPTPGVHSNSRPSSRWCHPAISSSVVPFSSCPQSLPASESLGFVKIFCLIISFMSVAYVIWTSGNLQLRKTHQNARTCVCVLHVNGLAVFFFIANGS